MKFSIIIPCYNVEAFVAETLDSVLAQTYSDWECICVDDGSTDGSPAILDGYAARDARFRVIHKGNAGVSAARNDAIAVAKGDYVCFLDGDDVWDKDWLARVEESTDGGRADIVRMQLTFWRNDDACVAVPECLQDSHIEYLTGEKDVLTWGWSTYTTDGYIVLNIVRREMLTKNGLRFPEGMKINEDIVFDLQLLPFAQCVAQSSYAGYYYRMRSTSAWHAERPIEGCVRYIAESNRLWSDNRTRLERLGCVDKVRRNQAFMIWSSLVQWIEFGVEDERKRVGEITRELRIAWQGGMLDMRSIPFCWRPSFWVACRIGWMFLMYATFHVLDVYHGIHRKLI